MSRVLAERMRLRSREVRARLGLSGARLRALVRDGALVPVEVSSRLMRRVWVFRTEDVERYEERAARVRLLQTEMDLPVLSPLGGEGQGEGA